MKAKLLELKDTVEAFLPSVDDVIKQIKQHG